MVGQERKFRPEEVAKIARLELMEDEIKRMEKDLSSIIEAFGELDQIDPECEPSFQPLEMKNVVRKDSVEPSFSQEEALSLTKHKEKGFFKGPRVI